MPDTQNAVGGELEAHYQRVAAWSLALEAAITPAGRHLDEILEIADALDQHFAWEPYGEADETANPSAEAGFKYLLVATPEDLERAIRKLPVFPAAAQRALRLLMTDTWSGTELEAIARTDQTLAAHLLSAANSWIYGAGERIATLSQAITYIGATRTFEILYAASAKPLFSTGRLRDLWDHSLIAAQAAETLATFTRAADPKEAFLAGLVHDIGRLAMAMLPPAFQSRYEHLTEVGCETFVVERVLSGFSHAKAGVCALRAWNFPEPLIEAVEFHHQPEKSESNLAAILFLVEHWSDSGEDVPSAARLKIALDRTGISATELAELTPTADRSMDGLRFA